MHHVDPIKLFEHCRLILGMVLSLSVARLLNGFARFVQHPHKAKVFLPHILWAFMLLLYLVHFWWWEFRLIQLTQWTFENYFLLILYATQIFLLCCLLFPDDIQEYSGFEDYFLSRRKWFFAIFIATIVIDFWDTAMKGHEYFQALGMEYVARNVVYLGVFLAGIFSKNVRVHLVLALIALIYEATSILRLYHTMR